MIRFVYWKVKPWHKHCSLNQLIVLHQKVALDDFSRLNNQNNVGLLELRACYYLEVLSNLFEVLTESYPKAAFPMVEHL